jgi:hypothetical protein
MSPEQLLELAGQSGLTLSIERDALLIRGSGFRPAELLEELRGRVEDIVPLLECAPGWPA